MIRKILVSFAVLVVLAVAGFAVFVAARQHLTFDAPYPPLRASADSAVIARGRYVVRTVAVCSGCHGDPAATGAAASDPELALIGGFHWDIPPGTFYARNITPDVETGIGTFPDSAIARALRYGVGHDGRALLPFMDLQGLSDEDLVAVISYLRTQPPVRNVVPPHRFTLLGKVVRATVLAAPTGPSHAALAVSPRGATVEAGRYLVEDVARCGGCHTQRNPATGAMTGPHLGGATGFTEANDPHRAWAPANITRDSATGRLASLSEDGFVARFRAGPLLPGSPMPWTSYGRMSEDDLRAIYRYLKTVPPARHDVGPPVVTLK